MSNVLAWIFRERHIGLKSLTFVTSVFSKTETFYISLMFAMDLMISLPAVALKDNKKITVKCLHCSVVSNKTYDECYRLLESNSSTYKFGSL